MEALVRASFAGHVAAIRDLERREDDALRVKHSAELERLRERVCVAALGVRGADEVRHRCCGIHGTPRCYSTTFTSRRPVPLAPQVSAKVHALNHLVKIKMATGEYAAAWDARNAANKLREMERVDAENRHLDAPGATLATAQLLARHDQEARDLLAEQHVRAARLEREIQTEIERRGGPRGGDTNPAAAVGGATMGRWLDVRDARTEHQTRWTQRENARIAPGILPTPAPPPPPRPSAAPPASVAAAPAPPRAPPRRPSAVAAFLVAAGDATPFEASYAGTPTTLGAGASMALTLSAYARDAATFETESGVETFASASASAFAADETETGVEIPGPARTAEETPTPHSPTRSVDREEYVFGRRRTWTRAPEAPENHRGTPRASKLPPRSSLPPTLVSYRADVDARTGEAGTMKGPDHHPRGGRRPAVHVPPLDFREVLRDAEQRSRTHARVRDPATRAAAVRGYGEYVDGSAGGFASKEARGKDARGGKGARRGFTTGHDEPARGSDLEGRVGGGVGGGTDGSRFLRAGEAEGDGCAPSEHSSDLSSDDVSSDDVSDGIGAGDAEVWSATPERLREALTDPGGGGGARGELRAAARRGGGPVLDVAVARVFRGAAAAEEAREAADGKENVEDGGGGDGGGGGGEGAKSAAAKGRAPTGSFFRERRGPRAHGASLPSNTAGHTATRVRT